MQYGLLHPPPRSLQGFLGGHCWSLLQVLHDELIPICATGLTVSGGKAPAAGQTWSGVQPGISLTGAVTSHRHSESESNLEQP